MFEAVIGYLTLGSFLYILGALLHEPRLSQTGGWRSKLLFFNPDRIGFSDLDHAIQRSTLEQ
jgi:hypothetical protein